MLSQITQAKSEAVKDPPKNTDGASLAQKAESAPTEPQSQPGRVIKYMLIV